MSGNAPGSVSGSLSGNAPDRGAPDRPTDRNARIADLMQSAAAGSEPALGEIVTELSPLLWQVARAAGLSSGDAEDVLQTVWMRLIAHLDDIRSPAALTAWLVVTARREAWRVRAAGRRQLPADQDWLAALPDEGPTSEEQAIVDDQRRALWTAIARLSPRCQELLRIIAFVPRPDYAVVAGQLGIPRGSVGPTRGRCLEKLRACLAAGPEVSPQ
jgi:RNA polymerase sigma factor (sigma-70 family)